MKEIATHIQTPIFWFSSVFVALLMNIFSHFVSRWLTHRFAAIRRWKKALATAGSANRTAALATFLSEHTNGTLVLYGHSVSLLLASLINYLLAFACMYAGIEFSQGFHFNWISALFGALGLWACIYGLLLHTAADTLRDAVVAHEEGLQELFDSLQTNQ